MSAHMPGDRSFQLLEVVAERLDASPAVGRRRWSAEAKARLVAEALAPGANVSAIARQNGMAVSQLFGWRRRALAAGSAEGAGDGPASTGAPIEIVIGEVVIRVSADIGEERLRRVLRAVRSA